MVSVVEADIKNGPDKATGAMAVLVAMLMRDIKQANIRSLWFPWTTAHRMAQNFVNLS